jgi:hypothetical protein
MLLIVLGILGVLAVLFIAAAVIDVKARRRGVRYRGVDQASTRDERRRYEAELNTRTNGRLRDPGSGGPFTF